MDGTAVLRAAWDFGDAVAQPAEGGLINQTWWVQDNTGQRAVMQALNTKIFRPEVHEDIEAVTAHVADKGLLTPRLVRTRTGDLFHTADDGGVYRVLTLVGDRTVHKLVDSADARSAARFLARYHGALRDLSWQFRMVRPGVHDTAVHFGRLEKALAEHTDHRLYAEVAAIAPTILSGWSKTETAPLPVRVVHGDPKISNMRFASSGKAVAMVDLDTFQQSTLSVELGDAMRSWCNPLAEDSRDAHFDVDLFEAAMAGYAEGAADQGVTEAEWDSILPGTLRIASELASRFAMDALVETYFGFDATKYATRGEHNLVRARGQAALAASMATRMPQAKKALARARGH